MPTDTTKLKHALEKAFGEIYDDETAGVLAELHALYHVKFVQKMAEGPGHGDNEGNRTIANNTKRVKAAVRRANKGDVLPKGPKTEALYDEIVDMIFSAGEVSMAELQNAAVVIGSEPDVIRVAVTRLLRAGRIKRIEGPRKTGRYTCT